MAFKGNNKDNCKILAGLPKKERTDLANGVASAFQQMEDSRAPWTLSIPNATFKQPSSARAVAKRLARKPELLTRFFLDVRGNGLIWVSF